MATPPQEAGEEILDSGAALLTNFIIDRVHHLHHGDGEVNVSYTQLGGTELIDSKLKQVAEYLKRIGDELDSNAELQSMINCSDLQPTRDVFLNVACQIFADGVFNWGRVVALFYFACRLVIKALVTNIPDIIKTIISWTVDYLREHLVNWIREQGGWEGIKSYFEKPAWQKVGVAVGCVLLAALVIKKM